MYSKHCLTDIDYFKSRVFLQFQNFRNMESNYKNIIYISVANMKRFSFIIGKRNDFILLLNSNTFPIWFSIGGPMQWWQIFYPACQTPLKLPTRSYTRPSIWYSVFLLVCQYQQLPRKDHSAWWDKWRHTCEHHDHCQTIGAWDIKRLQRKGTDQPFCSRQVH